MASVLALIQNRNAQVLFVRRSLSSSRPGQWCLPGGKIKRDEDAISALIREVREETGLDVIVSGQLADFGDQSYWHCQTSSSEAVQLNPGECCASAWCDPQQILSLGFIMDLKRLRLVLKGLGVDELL